MDHAVEVHTENMSTSVTKIGVYFVDPAHMDHAPEVPMGSISMGTEGTNVSIVDQHQLDLVQEVRTESTRNNFVCY